jgi:hypothetical protein
VKKIRFLIVGLFVAFGISGCFGDKRWYGTVEILHVTKNENGELCFFIDDFGGVDKYYINRIDSSNQIWVYSEDIVRKNGRNVIIKDTTKLVKLSSIVGKENCLPYGTNLDASKQYNAKKIDFNKPLFINIYAFIPPTPFKDTDILFENTLYFKYNQNTKKYDIELDK